MDSSSELAKVVAALKEAGFSGFATSDEKTALDWIKERDRPGVRCNYRGQPRRVHPECCRWHREQNDPECAACGEERARTEWIGAEAKNRDHCVNKGA
jgi:hypothetical protein